MGVLWAEVALEEQIGPDGPKAGPRGRLAEGPGHFVTLVP